jgi:prephenate dehydrogenase (NADP+)
MGTAWANSLSNPREHGYYVEGIETVKASCSVSTQTNDVYAGLAIVNPSAQSQIDQFAKSATEFFKLMIKNVCGSESIRIGMLCLRGRRARDREPKEKEPILDRFSPMKMSSPPSPTRRGTANSHLSLLAMVDCWAHLRIQPLVHLDLATTPIFCMWIGVAEYLFRSPARLDAAIEAALYDVSHHSDDLEFVVAVRGWSQCVSFGCFELYRQRFMQTAEFFRSRFEDAVKVGEFDDSAYYG